jgi:uncharacterized membrane protein (UPF0127 family)
VPKASSFLKKYAALIIILILLAGGVTAALIAGGNGAEKKTPLAAAASGCGPYRKDGVMTINNQPFNVEIAYNQAARIRGLSGRPCIPAHQGLLMDFGKDGHYRIWMKDMKFPIDVVWIGSDHKIAAVEINFKPSTYDSRHPERSEVRVNQIPARYVLEIKANTSRDLNFGLGTSVHFQKA